MRARVGDAVADVYRCFSPPVDDLSAYADLGTTADGVPVRVFRPVAEADLRILIGSVLPHLQAGFGGGYKLIFPGTSHRTTLGALHAGGSARARATARPCSAARRPRTRCGGRSPGRPVGSARASRSATCSAPRVRSCGSASGHPDPVQDALSAEARLRFRAPDAPPADLVVAGNHPWPGDPLQSFKVLLQHRAACRKGGVLVGFFWTDPGEIDRSFPLGRVARAGRLAAPSATGPSAAA